MSIMRCPDCERFVDTDSEEMVDVGNMRRLERLVCERCAEEIAEERDGPDGLPQDFGAGEI